MEKSDRSRFFRHAATVTALAGAVACSAASSAPERVTTASSDLVIGGLFPTGVDALGAAVAPGTVDLHYALSSNDVAFPGPAAVAVAPNPAWTGNTLTSSWISVQVSRAGAADAVYTYTTTFTLLANPATATLAGSWAADDSVTLMLNGTAVTQRPATAYGSVTAFTVPAGSPFQIGVNTLAFATVNSGGGPTGLQVVTLTGSVAECIADAQCTAAQFCDTVTNACTAKLADGIAIPSLAGHVPVLGGACTPLVGTAVCASGACDIKDNLCGLANGDGPCVAGATPVCRSGHCSVTGVCEAPGACASDADCAEGTWCDETTSTCTAKIANGGPVPTDPAHTGPTLNGQCTVTVGTLVCVSGVCDLADNECGLPDGAGPCTTVDGGAAVCRSGACSTVGVCEAPGACLRDADCTGGRWCDESTATCTAKIVNGTALPVDPPHTDPTLNGECIPTAAALVCVSGVCDIKDNACGYANGDGPCAVANAGVVCRSLACSVDDTCKPAGGCNVDGDCVGATPDCDLTTHACVAATDGGKLDGGVEGGSAGNDGGDAGDGGGGAGDGGLDAGDAGEGGTTVEGGDAGDAGDAGDTGETGDAGEASVTEGDAGGEDSAAPGNDSGEAEAATDGYVDGGGLSCAISSGSRGGATVAGGLGVMVLLGVARRRAARRRR